MKLIENLLYKKGSLSYEAFSKITNVPQTTLKDICNGNNKNPKLDTLIKLANAFETNIHKLVFENLQEEDNKE